MKLPYPVRDIKRDLAEFDIWITPSLGDITESPRFLEELDSVCTIFDQLGAATQNFKDIKHCEPASIAERFAKFAERQSRLKRIELFQSLAATLFLVTGKSDNNAKCQFPLFLRDVSRWPGLLNKRGGTDALPRVLKSNDFLKRIAGFEHGADESRLLEQIVSFLLFGDNAVRQFWAIGHSYHMLKALGRGYERDLLAPIVVFKVRGSVSASGGHRPEALLRQSLLEWGMTADVDFNRADFVVEVSDPARATKTRAYDFVLPFRTAGWSPGVHNRVLMQSQFYAGDSGSVSHKNVDQTTTSRSRVLNSSEGVRFVEFVDGAGYFASLNVDLRRLLNMDTTQSFVQIRSIPIRLRRELQQLGYITPLEIGHAVILANGDEARMRRHLVDEGYSEREIARAASGALANNWISKTKTKLVLGEQRVEIVRRHFILDTLAIHGRAIEPGSTDAAGAIFVSGYGPFYGIQMDELVRKLRVVGGTLTGQFKDTEIFMGDIKSLSERHLVLIGR